MVSHIGQSSAPLYGVKVSHFLTKRRALVVWACAALLFVLAWWWRTGSMAAPDRVLSPLARRTIRTSSPPMQRVRGEFVRVYATNAVMASAILDEAEFSIGEISRRLGVAGSKRPVRILLLGDFELIQREGFRPDSLAINFGDEIFLKDDAGQLARPDRVTHELVHFVLREAYGSQIPLWLDEGLAARLGLAVSKSYRASRGRRVTGRRPGLSADRMDTLEVLTRRHTLPDDPEDAAVFYRASEELVGIIEDSIGTSRMPAYIAEVAEGEDWRAALNARLDGSPLINVSLEEAVRKRVTSQRDF